MYSTVLCKKFAFNSVIHDLGRSINVDSINMFNKSIISATCAKLFSNNAKIAIQSNGSLFFQSEHKRTTIISDRYYCKDYRPFPEVPEFPPVVWPNIFKSIKALLYTFLIIKPQFDQNFSLGDFSKNSRKAVGVVSSCIARRDFSSLHGLVTNDVLEQVKSIVSNLSDTEIKNMGFNEEDMYLFLPINLDIISDAKFKDRRFVEITMCYHAIHNLEEIKKRSEEIDIQKDLKSSIYVLNYRFIREYTEGVKDAWTINAINHLKAEEHDKMIL